MSELNQPLDRGRFLNLATVVEGSLIVAALGLGWLAGIDPLETFRWEWSAVGIGMVGMLPLFGLFLLSYFFAGGPLGEIKRFLVDTLGPSLDRCYWYDLALLGIVAGFSEELLFRGLLQPWFERLGFAAGLIGSNILFALAHLITPAYAILAGLVGVYLGLLFYATEQPNVVIPMVTHGVYDFLAFLVVARTYRNKRLAEADDDRDGASERSE